MLPYMHMYELDENTLNPIYVSTDSSFEKVEWRVENADSELELVWTDTGSGTWSVYTPSWTGKGGFLPARRTVEATAYDSDGNSDTESIEIKVWKVYDKIWITSLSGPENAIEKVPCPFWAYTAPAFSKVEWYVMEVGRGDWQLKHTDMLRPPFNSSTFRYTFPLNSGRSDLVGKLHKVKAVAYATVGDATDEKEMEVRVHARNGNVLWESVVEIDLVEKIGRSVLKAHSHHWLRYYSDQIGADDEVEFYAGIEWYESPVKRGRYARVAYDSKDFIVDLHPPVFNTKTYTRFMNLACSGKDRHFYYAAAFTRAHATDWDKLADPDRLGGSYATEIRRLEEWDQYTWNP